MDGPRTFDSDSFAPSGDLSVQAGKVIRSAEWHCGTIAGTRLFAQTRWRSERTRAFVALRIEGEETRASEGTGLPPQRLCGPAQRRCDEASFYLAAQSETRSAETVCVCWDDRNSGRPPIRKSQERLQVSLGREEIWRAIDAGALRASKPDAV